MNIKDITYVRYLLPNEPTRDHTSQLCCSEWILMSAHSCALSDCVSPPSPLSRQLLSSCRAACFSSFLREYVKYFIYNYNIRYNYIEFLKKDFLLSKIYLDQLYSYFYQYDIISIVRIYFYLMNQKDFYEAYEKIEICANTSMETPTVVFMVGLRYFRYYKHTKNVIF